MSCGAAVRAKPKARLCEPWAPTPYFNEPRSGEREPLTQIFSSNSSLVALEQHLNFETKSARSSSIAAPRLIELTQSVTQGSQSLALGLVLSAAPQLVG